MVRYKATFLRALLQKTLHFTCGLETFFVVRWWGNGSRELKITHGAQERCTMKSAHPQTRGEFLRVFSHIACWLSHLSQNAFLSSVWRRNTSFPALPAVGETRNRQIRARKIGCSAFWRRRHFEVFCTKWLANHSKRFLRRHLLKSNADQKWARNFASGGEVHANVIACALGPTNGM